MAMISENAVQQFLTQCGIDFTDVFRVVFTPDEVNVFRYHRNEEGDMYFDADIGEAAMRMETITVDRHG